MYEFVIYDPEWVSHETDGFDWSELVMMEGDSWVSHKISRSEILIHEA